MSASVEGNVIADVMSKKPNVTITRFPAIIRVDGVGKLGNGRLFNHPGGALERVREAQYTPYEIVPTFPSL